VLLVGAAWTFLRPCPEDVWISGDVPEQLAVSESTRRRNDLMPEQLRDEIGWTGFGTARELDTVANLAILGIGALPPSRIHLRSANALVRELLTVSLDVVDCPPGSRELSIEQLLTGRRRTLKSAVLAKSATVIGIASARLHGAEHLDIQFRCPPDAALSLANRVDGGRTNWTVFLKGRWQLSNACESRCVASKELTIICRPNAPVAIAVLLQDIEGGKQQEEVRPDLQPNEALVVSVAANNQQILCQTAASMFDVYGWKSGEGCDF